MSIQRYGDPSHDYMTPAHDDGFLVLYSDHVAAVAAAKRVGYHSQRCLHCDHIRATHTLTASGCLGHALPGKPGADCPCSEFEEETA